MIKLKCLGAGREVGRSGFILDSGDKILLDYGVKLTPHGTEYPLPVETNLNAAVISHAHLDHSGNLPHLFLRSNPLTYTTPSTMELAKMLWFDTLKIAGTEGMDATFSKEEVERAEKYTFEINYRRNLDITPNTTLEFFDSGHILGAAMTLITTKGRRVFYTGDYKMDETRLHSGADLDFGEVDYLIIESTYGDRNHPPRLGTEKAFAEAVNETLERNGHVLVPAFALGRTQEMIDVLYEHRINGEIYLDGMGQTASRIMLKYPQYLKSASTVSKALKKANWVNSMGMRKKALKEPSVIVATAGMLQGGPIQYYIAELYNDKKSSLFMTGFQVSETPGRVLLETGKININGVDVEVKMNVRKFDFSAHAAQSELLKTIDMLKPRKVVCVHGDADVSEIFVKQIESLGFEAVAPKQGQEVVLE